MSFEVYVLSVLLRLAKIVARTTYFAHSDSAYEIVAELEVMLAGQEK